MNLDFLGFVITVTIGDIIGGFIIFCLILWFLFFFGRYQFYKLKYKKCPKCGSDTRENTDVSYLFGKSESTTSLHCRNCNWEKEIF